jgi:hypothetical protein
VQRHHLREFDKLTDAAVVAVAENCKGITSVSFEGCDNPTDAVVVAVGYTSVNFGGCGEYGDFSKLTDAALVAAEEHCKDITPRFLF